MRSLLPSPRVRRRLAVSAILAAAALTPTATAAAEPAPTCSGTLGIANHGHHIVGDYITGLGRDALDWSPAGGIVGQTIGGEGAAVPGAPGPGSHFLHGFAPGASFCLDVSQSPGAHPGP